MPEGQEGASVFGVTPTNEAPEVAPAPTAPEPGIEPAPVVEPTIEPEGTIPPEPGVEPGAEELPAWEYEIATAAGPKKFASKKEADHYFSSWNGRIAQADRERNEALSALDEWDKFHNANREGIDAMLKGGKAPTAGEEKKEPEFVDGISWDYVDELLAAGKPKDAQRYVAWKTGEHLKTQVASVKKEVQDELRESIGPIQEQDAIRNMSVEVMIAAQSARDSDHPEISRFPEFQEGTPTYNPDFVSAFGIAWKKLEADTALKPDLTGVELAYWRTKNTFVQKGAVAGDDAQAAIDAEQEKFRKSTADRAVGVGGGPVPTKTAPGGKGPTLQDKLFDGMQETGRNEVFGTRNREKKK